MNEQTKKYILIGAFTAWALALVALYIQPGRILFVWIPMIIFAALHYCILQKMLNQKYPFQNLRSINNNHLSGAIVSYSIFAVGSTLLFVLIAALKSKYIELIGPGLFVLLFAITTTVAMLIFSHYFFAKPIKETWKAVLLASIIAGASGYTLSYGLWKIMRPYLPAGTSKVQPVGE